MLPSCDKLANKLISDGTAGAKNSVDCWVFHSNAPLSRERSYNRMDRFANGRSGRIPRYPLCIRDRVTRGGGSPETTVGPGERPALLQARPRQVTVPALEVVAHRAAPCVNISGRLSLYALNGEAFSQMQRPSWGQIPIALRT